MKLLYYVLLLGLGLNVPGWVQAQSYDTPPFNFDRSTDRVYVDSLLQATRLRLKGLDRYRPTPRVDTARMEYQHFMAQVQYSSVVYRDSSLQTAQELVRWAERRKNVKYQIKGLLMLERCERVARTHYAQAIQHNYRLLSLIETAPAVYAMYYWRVYRNLGQISIALGEYDEAAGYLQKSLAWFEKDQKIDPVHRSDLHRILANSYKGQQQWAQAEKQYLLAWELLNRQPQVSMSNKAYLSNDIGQIYNSQRKFAQAVPYLRQSVTFWTQLKAPLPQADALADLAVAYLGLNQLPEAIACAREALAKNQKVYAPMLTAYSVLAKAFETQRDWQRAFEYQQLYHAKKWEEQEAINQTETLRTKVKVERERLEAAHRQAELLQQQRYQTLAKQAEIDRLNHTVKLNELRRLTQTRALRHELETQQLRATAAQKQAGQQAMIKQLKIDQLHSGLSAQKRFRNLLLTGIAVVSLLGLLLLYYSLRLRRTNVALRAKNREIELALVRGQSIERKRVATELHDRVSSLLGATKMTFQTIDADILSPRDRQLYENSLNLLTDAATQVRQLSRNLLPEEVLQQDLTVSLKSLIRKLNGAEKTRFSLNLETAETLPMPPEVKFNLYVICLELSTNILRHARAGQARIRLAGQANGLMLEVSDDGIGMENPATGGIGLGSIRERAEAIGAQFSLEAVPGSGTTARVWLPLTTGWLPVGGRTSSSPVPS
ncbi:tetratricopeptide repeat-containing sensor histidine kinase [Larkinella sp. VNQ87]|uniref:tetratricopeptide repeat-containing sensor histidine kinase n=1 Tax=Larkinella sp. VNQ87 TaxID=3400921 RepID=UPI003C02D8D1